MDNVQYESLTAYAVTLGEAIGMFRWHNWKIPQSMQTEWEEVLDGTFAARYGHGDRIDEVAEIALAARSNAFEHHDATRCEWHRQMRRTMSFVTA